MQYLLTAGDTPTLTDVLTDGGVAVDLTDAAVVFLASGPAAFTQAGTITDALTGSVAVTLTAVQTALAGVYAGQWRVTIGAGVVHYPAEPFAFQVAAPVPAEVPAEVSQLRDLIEPVRALVGDLNAASYQYEDANLVSVLRSVVRLGRVPGYRLSADAQAVTPAFTDGTVRSLALLVYHAAKTLLLPNVASYHYRTRALSERFGEQTRFLFDLESAIYDLEFGEMFQSFQTFHAWLVGTTGVPLTFLVGVTVDLPLSEVQVPAPGL